MPDTPSRPGLRRVAVNVPASRAEEARATMIELFPDGFEEREQSDGVELAAYTDWSGEERLWQVFGGARTEHVDADWSERWRTFHRPARVGPLWVGPPWLEPDGDALAVVIDPGQAFGTGAHATSRLCLQFLLGLERGSLLDAGCGSGVLAIAASKLGYAPIRAVDIDHAAVEATRANAAANSVEIDASVLDATAGGLPAADVCVANIAIETVLRLAPGLRSARLLTSGYLERERPEPGGFRHVERSSAEGWAADLFVRE